ncbi:hypothetical protein RN001_010805 [Aquatica leii]|uniref:NF-kappa-B-repressing factor n=1 Tax=Aquatica leii TaxID=1421715 RepID=A0AAN7PV96_9COLE|nr:hypothetical protein RN001_010805 [Aquatica leii]
MNRRNRKRKYDDYKRPKQFKEKFEIVGRVKSQGGVRSQLVFTHGSFNIDPITILSNAIDRVNATLNIRNIGAGTEKDSNRFALYINNERIVDGDYFKEDVARKDLAKLAIDELKKTCFTIFRKIRPRDSETVNVNSTASTSTTTPEISGIGAKMLLKMGWSGGGLGSQGQGITEIIKPSNQIDRQGLGTEHSLPIDEIKSVLHEYAASDNINSISFSPDFLKEERAVIHSVAKTLNLKSSSYGTGKDRRLVVQKKMNPWQLINTLLEIGGENEQYQLILPSNFVE